MTEHQLATFHRLEGDIPTTGENTIPSLNESALVVTGVSGKLIK